MALWVSCFEIYGGKLYDLLNSRQPLVMREDGKGRVCIVGLKEVRFTFVYHHPPQPPCCRNTGATGLNMSRAWLTLHKEELA